MPSLPKAFVIAVVVAYSSPSLAVCDKIEQQQHANACAAREASQSDDRMNSLYNSLLKIIQPAAKIKLAAAQQAWVEFRNKSCQLEGHGVEGGSLHSYVLGVCYKDMTDKRVEKLKQYLTCDDVDASCVRGF